MSFILPIRPSRSSKTPKTLMSTRTTKTLQPPPESPRRRPSLATRAGVTKRRASVSTTFNAPSMSFFEAMFGDDFPDTFAHDGRSCKSKRTILELPAEIIEILCQHLSKLDVKRLRLSSRELADKVALRIERVYVSPNRANLDCLNNIIHDPRYSLQVQELIWDDAQLECLPTFDIYREHIESDQAKARVALEGHLSTLFQSNSEDEVDYESIGVQDCIQDDGGLTDIGKVILLNANDEHSKNIIANCAASMSLEDSYILYQKLYQDEKEIIKRGWDVAVLQRAFEQLANLKRVTVTTEVWRPWNLLPTYDTPFYRALPAGFCKPSVWPWIDRSRPHSLDLPGFDQSAQHLPTKWRGYSIIISLLTSGQVPNLEDFILDTGHENIGLPMELIVSPNVDYTHSIDVLSTRALKKLQLSVIEHPCNDGLRGRNIGEIGRLKSIIGATSTLTDLDLKWSIPPSYREELPDQIFDGNFLRARCPGLEHIALRHARISQEWLYNVISSLENLKTVTLDKICMESRVKDEVLIFSRLQQHYFERCSRGPAFTWIDYLCDPFDTNNELHNSKWWVVVDRELNDFLYDGGALPFERPNDSSIRREGAQCVLVKPDVGWLMNGRDPTVCISTRRVSTDLAKVMRNPWPVDGSTATAQSRIY